MTDNARAAGRTARAATEKTKREVTGTRLTQGLALQVRRGPTVPGAGEALVQLDEDVPWQGDKATWIPIGTDSPIAQGDRVIVIQYQPHGAVVIASPTAGAIGAAFDGAQCEVMES